LVEKPVDLGYLKTTPIFHSLSLEQVAEPERMAEKSADGARSLERAYLQRLLRHRHLARRRALRENPSPIILEVLIN